MDYSAPMLASTPAAIEGLVQKEIDPELVAISV
jgi:hypothetical protein